MPNSEQQGALNISNLMLSVQEVQELEERMLELLREIKLKSLAAARDGTERKLWDITVMMAREDLPGLAGS